MLKIGITGGIGSGKTTACKIFEILGIPIYYADDRAKALMVNDSTLVQKIKDIFGEEAYLEDGSLNRPHIASLAFNDQSKLSLLNAAVHPAVREDGINWHLAQKNVPYTLKEAALLFESGGNKVLDKIITVTAPEAVRIERIKERDNATIEQIKARMDKQMPEDQKVALADYVIYNDGQQPLIPQIFDIHHKLVTASKKHLSD